MFTKKDRSTFPYWAAHVFAYNMTATNCHHWKFKYLFHDFLKPWMKLFMPYSKVKEFHRNHSKHHIEYFLKHGTADYEAMALDWECSRFSKEDKPLNATETLEYECEEMYDNGVPLYKISFFHSQMVEALVKLGIVDWKINKTPRYLITRYLITRCGCAK